MLTTRIRACLLAVALVAGACAGDDDASPDVTVDPTATTAAVEPPAETTTTTADPRVAVEQAFYDQWDAFVEILEAPDPANPLIERFFTGAARDAILDTISADVEAGYITRRPDDPAHFVPGIESIEFVDESTAVVVECTIDGLVVLRSDTGEVVNDNVVTARLENTFKLEAGQWKLLTNKGLDQTDGAVACD